MEKNIKESSTFSPAASKETLEPLQKIKDFAEEFAQDLTNINNSDDYLICSDFKEINEAVLRLSKEIKVVSDIKGKFTEKINEYLLVSRASFIDEYKRVYKSLLSFNDGFKRDRNLIKTFDISSISLLLSSINSVLLFNDNQTFYSLKRKIILKSTCKFKASFSDVVNLLRSELLFTQTTNEKSRKSAVSWAYRTFLYSVFSENFSREQIAAINRYNKNENKVDFRPFGGVVLCEGDFVYNEVLLCDCVNVREGRNYHMWTHLRRLFDSNKKNNYVNGCKIIVLYAVIKLAESPNDYSAFSFIVNSDVKSIFTKEEVEMIRNYLSENKGISNKDYIKDIYQYL